MDFALIQKVFPFFLEGAWVTIQLAFFITILGLICGALGTAAKLSRFRFLRWLGNAYVSVFRGTPALIQLFLFYFGGPQIGIQLDTFQACIIAFGINVGAYMTETIRGAIISVDKGQREAARTLGLSQFQAFYKIIFPQAARLMVRPLGVNINMLIKSTSLAATISLIELTYTAQRFIASTYRPFEMFVIAGVLYIIIIYITGRAVTWLDRRVQIP